MIKKCLETLVKLWFVWPILFFGGCSGFTASVINDMSALQTASGWAVMLALGGMAVVFVVSLFKRRYFVSVAVAVSAGIAIVAGFITMVMIGLGQHHPPRQTLEEAGVDTTDYAVLSADYREVLDSRLPKDSWWTDGQHYFQVKTVGNAYRLEGMTLHEGGLEALLETRGDSIDLWVAQPRSGENCFASVGCKVVHYDYTLFDEDYTHIELLIAYEGDGYDTPVAALQHFDGDELKFELAGIHALLEGTYTDGKTEWTLLSDGTIRLSPDAEANPYTVERFYHQLTNVVRLPDGRHVALQLGDDDTLLVLAAAYDDGEEQWDEARPRQVLMRLPRKECTLRRDMNVLDYERLLTPAMLTFMDGDIYAVASRYGALGNYNESPIGHLNAALLIQWQWKQLQSDGEND